MLSKTLLLPSLLAVTAFASAGDTFTVDTSPRSSVSAALFPPLVVPPSVGAHPCKSSYKRLPPLREQEAIELGWIQKRMALVPRVLEKYGFDAYILSMREYAEDTIFRAFNPYTTIFSARRRTTYLFHTAAPSDEIPASPLLLIDNTPSLFATVNATLEMLDPRKIAVNVDRDLAFADGLHTGEGETLKANLGPKWSSRLDSERMIPVEISATRVGGAEQLGYYRNMQESVWAMIEEGFSDKVITPGETTTQDLIWWFRERMETMNVTTWFHPSVSVFRGDFATHPGQPFPSPDEGDETIYEGDMLHTDVGIYAMGMATDTQHLAYVLRANETDAPMSLKAGLAKSNRLQDIVRKTMKPGRTGDETLAKVRATFEAEELQGLIYCHPIGDFGHAAGTLIGMTNLQKSVPGSGPLPMLKDTWYSIELSAESFIPEWNRTQSFAQEEDVAWNEDTQTWEWVWGRQERFHLVRSSRHKKSGETKHEGSWLVVKAAQKLGWTVGRWW